MWPKGVCDAMTGKKPRMKEVKINLREVIEERDVEKILLDNGYTYNKELHKSSDPGSDMMIYSWIDDDPPQKKYVNAAKQRQRTNEFIQGNPNLDIRNIHEEVEHLRRQAIIKDTELAQVQVTNAQLRDRVDALESHSKVRPEVAWFSTLMESKLAKNDYKGGWQKSPPNYLLSRMLEECGELIEECCIPQRDGWILKQMLHHVAQFANEISSDWSVMRSYFAPLAIRGECIDIANFCMMIAERATALEDASQFTANELENVMDKCACRKRCEDGVAICNFKGSIDFCTQERRNSDKCSFAAFREVPTNDDKS